MKDQRISVLFALLAAALYAVNVPKKALVPQKTAPSMRLRPSWVWALAFCFSGKGPRPNFIWRSRSWHWPQCF